MSDCSCLTSASVCLIADMAEVDDDASLQISDSFCLNSSIEFAADFAASAVFFMLFATAESAPAAAIAAAAPAAAAAAFP